jgi:hypothetical protein
MPHTHKKRFFKISLASFLQMSVVMAIYVRTYISAICKHIKQIIIEGKPQEKKLMTVFMVLKFAFVYIVKILIHEHITT